MTKSYLFVLRSAPHSGLAVQEMLDIVLTTAAFEQQVALLLLDDAVFVLKNNQQPEKYQLKDTSAIFKALEIYDVNDIYVEIESLEERGLKRLDLNFPVQTVERQKVATLMKQYSIVFAG
jgi:tRNA 2-thiouridine synthesizing protein C